MCQFSRTVASMLSRGPVSLALMKHYKWQKAAMLVGGGLFDAGLGIYRELRNASIDVHSPALFEPGNFRAATLSEIRHSGHRVVILMALEEDVKTVTLRSAEEGMTNGWAWLVMSDRLQRTTQLQGWLFPKPLLPSRGMQAFAEQVSKYAASRFNITVDADSVDLTYSAALHDAIMLYAHAATKVLLEGGNLREGQAVTEAVRSTSFKGVGGRAVSLDEQGDRIESYEVMNYVVAADGGVGCVPVGFYSSDEQRYTAYARAVIWPGNTTNVPVDYSSGACWHAAFESVHPNRAALYASCKLLPVRHCGH